MSFRILVVAATTLEIESFKKIAGLNVTPYGFSSGNTEMNVLVTGAGAISTSWSMSEWLRSNRKPDLALNIGIAGSFSVDIKPGDVVMPVSDCFADSGIEDGDNFLTLAEAGLAGANDFPFKSGVIESDIKYSDLVKNKLRPVKAVTVNTSTGSEVTRRRLVKKYNPDIETMEGATFFYICARNFIPFLALRAISNNVETRNRNNWNIPLALENLAEKCNELIIRLE